MKKVLTHHWFLLGLAFIIRLSYGVFYHAPHVQLFSDMANYNRIANAILANQWDPYHFFQPIGFPLILSLLKLISSHWGYLLGVIHALASTLTLWLMWDVTKNVIGIKWAKWILYIGTIHVPWIIYTGFLLSETLFTLTLAVLLWVTWKLISNHQIKTSPSFAWGLTLIIGFLLKGTHVLLAPLTFLAMFFYGGKQAVLKFMVPAGIAIAAGLMFNAVLTYTTVGHAQISASAGGLNLVEGKCPYKWNQDSNGITWLSPIYYQRRLDSELKVWDQPFYNSNYFSLQGLKCIKDVPSTMLLSIEGIPLLFTDNHMFPASALPQARWIMLYEYLFSFFMIPGMLVYFLMFFKMRGEERKSHLFVWVLPMLSLFLCVYIFKSEIRFRIPFDVWFIPVAVMGWKEVMTKLDSKEAVHAS